MQYKVLYIELLYTPGDAKEKTVEEALYPYLCKGYTVVQMTGLQHDLIVYLEKR